MDENRERARGLHKRQVKTLENQVAGALVVIGAWYWVVVVLIAAVLLVVELRTGEIGDGSVVERVLTSSRWFMFVMGLLIPFALLVPHVAAGGTRKAFVDGITRGALVGGGLFGLVATLLFLIERPVFGALDLAWFREGAAGPGNGFTSSVISEALAVATFFLVGVAVSVAYSRFGGWVGTALLPLFLVPAGLSQFLESGVVSDLVAPAAGLVQLLVLVGASAVVLVLAIVVVDRLLHDVPIKPAVA
ncbi:hypothetical protein L1785_19515 [Antribacter sp. KLBMP9083]|uniref:Uncharacterized protein n=1 Tax=Antribacter soli TaxID=2910976 RepID=A0AA41U955_9MICO|nr:hypothetical protein [Antribacter soli]MCF4123165.1 hypothetical protein [Antribacter soli]